jgi:sugar phosphate isomerase/epimerase
MTNPQISLQLYTLRHEIEKDFSGSLERAATIGFSQVEPWNFVARADEYAKAFAANGITAPSAHAHLVGVSRRETFEAAVKLGINTVIEPIVDQSKWQSADDISEIAHEMNKAAEEAIEYGLQVGYHYHAWESANKVNGEVALEFCERMLEDRVILEVDAYWVHAGGLHGPDLLSRLGKRVQFLHIKDGKNVRGSDNTFNERGELVKSETDTRLQVPAGRGEVPLAEVIATAPHALPIVEFDEYAGDIFEGITESLKYVKGLIQ